jgi:hypothetical protein
MQNFSSLQEMMNNGPAPMMHRQMAQMHENMIQQEPESPSKGVVSDKPYVCDVCGRGYSYLASLEQHKVILTKIKKVVA